MNLLFIIVLIFNVFTLFCLGRMFYQGAGELRSFFDTPGEINVMVSTFTAIFIVFISFVSVLFQTFLYSMTFF